MVKKRILPITVTTLEALSACAQEDCRLVYMNWVFFEGYRLEILQILRKYGYTWVDFHARNGVFYAKGIDPRKHYVANPYKIY